MMKASIRGLWISSLQRHVAQLKIVGAQRCQLDIGAAGPYDDLLVQGNVCEIVPDDGKGLADHPVACLAIELNGDLLDQFVERGIGVASLIPSPLAEIRAPRLREVAQHVQRV